MSVGNNYAIFEKRLATSSCINLKRTSRRQQFHIEQSFGQFLDITEVCKFSLSFHFINSLYFYALTGRNLTENRDILKLMRFVHKLINNFLIKQRRPVQNRVYFRGMKLYFNCNCKLDRRISLQEERDVSSISTATNSYETFPQGEASFIYGRQLERYFSTSDREEQRHTGVECATKLQLWSDENTFVETSLEFSSILLLSVPCILLRPFGDFQPQLYFDIWECK